MKKLMYFWREKISRLMIKRLLTVLIVAFSLSATAQNCFEIESILVDACTPPSMNVEGANEMVRFKIGNSPLNVANLDIKWATPHTASFYFRGICTNPSATSALNATIQKCGWLLEPPGGIIPAGATVILATSDTINPTYNQFTNLEDTIYIIYQCKGNAVNIGHFGNSTSNGIKTFWMNFTGSGGCADTVTYNPALLVNINGTTGGSSTVQNGSSVSYTPNGTATYYNNGCNAPIPISKLSIDTAIDAVGNMVIPANNNITICPYQDSIQLVGKSVNVSPKFFKWTGGSGTFTQPDSVKTTYLFSGSETFPLSLYLKSYGKCAGDTLRDTVVLNLYVPNLSTIPDTFICSGGSVTLATAGSGFSGHTWSPAAGLSCTGCAAPVASPSSATTYCVIATNGNGCKDTACVLVDTIAYPTITVSNDTTICNGQTVNLSITSTSTINNWSSNETVSTLSCTACTNPSVMPTSTATFAVASGNKCISRDTVNITVNPVITADVSLAVSQNPICAGSNVTFTATPTNGGVTPVYAWYLNGIIQANIGATYSGNAFTNNDKIKVIMASSAAPCLANPLDTSNEITLTVNPNLDADVTIAASATTICAGSNVTFTATPTNGGAAPVYQWQVNGVNAGTNSNTFSTTTLNNNDIVTVILTSNASPCLVKAVDTSNAVTMTVNPNLAADVTITASATTICAGSSVTFTATPVNGGSAPIYQWQINGVNAGTNSNTFSSSALNNNDQVTVILTSNASPCLVKAIDTSNTVVITVANNLQADVTIAANTTTICPSTNVTFTATPTNGGATPTYQWQVNGVNAGTNSATFSSTTLNNNDVVTVIMTSSLTNCLSNNPATSNAITMTVSSTASPTISISADNNPVCAGSSVTFTATITNGGSSPIYQWKLNGTNVGSNSNTYSIASPNNGDVVVCSITNNDACVATPTATASPITITVTPTVTPTISIAANPTAICENTPVTFTATITNGGSQPVYTWFKNSIAVGTNSATYTDNTLTSADIITCQLTSNATCANPLTVTSNPLNVQVNPYPVADAGADATIDKGESITLNGSGGGIYVWTANSIVVGNTASVTISPALTTTYTLEVTNTFGCKDTDIVNINVVYPNVSIYLPTAFSPNNDSKNDEYLIKSNQDFKFFDIKIYNRWGELVFSSNNLYDGWDGKFKGDSQPVGVYVVMVKAVPYSAPEQNFIQSVTLIK